MSFASSASYDQGHTVFGTSVFCASPGDRHMLSPRSRQSMGPYRFCSGVCVFYSKCYTVENMHAMLYASTYRVTLCMTEGEMSGAPSKSEISSDFPGRIKRLRDKLGLTQRRLAELMGVSFASVNRWENGQSRPSALAWQQITRAEMLGVEALSKGPDAQALMRD